VKDKKFHKYCMQCYFCGDKLTTSVALKDGQIACKDCAAGKKKIEGEPAAVKTQAAVKKAREELEKNRVPKMPDIVAQHHKSEEERAAATKPVSADDIDLKALCKEQKDAAKKVRQSINDADIRRVFSMIDIDGSGSVDKSEVGDLFIVLGLPLSVIPKVKELQIQYVMKELNPDETGEIEFKQFRYWFKQTDLKLFSKRLTSIEKSAIYFLSFVKGDSQEVCGDDMKKLHTAIVEAKLTKESYDKFIRAIDKDNSRSISFCEFIAWMDQQCKTSLFGKK